MECCDLQGVLLQVIRLPESDVLDVVRQTASRIISVIQHDSLQVTVQDVDPKRSVIVSRLI